MKFARIGRRGSDPVFAKIEGERASPLTGAPWAGGVEAGEAFTFTEDEIAVPVAPSKVLCVGRNYAAHAKEMGNEVPKEPFFFLKPPSALLPHGGAIVLPLESERVEHEAELAVVIGRRARNVSEADAMDHVFGYTVANDVTARDLQKKDGQWWRAKGFDTFCPVGPFVVEKGGIDASDLGISLTINGATRQSGRTSSMVFALPFLIAYASRALTLEPGDLLLTGTPEGTSPLADGDVVVVTIERVGTLSSKVVRPGK